MPGNDSEIDSELREESFIRHRWIEMRRRCRGNEGRRSCLLTHLYQEFYGRADLEPISYCGSFENPRTLSKPNELSQDSKAEKRTSVVVKVQGKTEGNPILLNSGAFSLYPESIGPGTFTNPREV